MRGIVDVCQADEGAFRYLGSVRRLHGGGDSRPVIGRTPDIIAFQLLHATSVQEYLGSWGVGEEGIERMQQASHYESNIQLGCKMKSFLPHSSRACDFRR